MGEVEYLGWKIKGNEAIKVSGRNTAWVDTGESSLALKSSKTEKHGTCKESILGYSLTCIYHQSHLVDSEDYIQIYEL